MTEQRRVSVRCHECPEVVSLGEQAEVVIEAGRGLSRARFEMAVDARAQLPLGATVELGKDGYRVVGLTRGLVASGGDPLAFLHLRNSQNLQFKLAPPVARRAPAAGTSGGSNHNGECRDRAAAPGRRCRLRRRDDPPDASISRRWPMPRRRRF